MESNHLVPGSLLLQERKHYRWYLDNSTGNFTLHSGATISGNSQGYDGGKNYAETGDGLGGGGGGASNGGGGGYGGTGGGSSQGAYGTLFYPDDLGSGGGAGNNWDGGDGGGAVTIRAAETINISGTINMNGGAGSGTALYDTGGGSGGTISLISSTFEGDGSLNAVGGNGGASSGGNGGGGRIYIEHASSYSYTGSMDISSGSGGTGGAKGTAIIYDSASKDLTAPIDQYGPWNPRDLNNRSFGNVLLQGDLIISGVYSSDSNGIGIVLNASGNVSIYNGVSVTGTGYGYDGGKTYAESGDGTVVPSLRLILPYIVILLYE